MLDTAEIDTVVDEYVMRFPEDAATTTALHELMRRDIDVTSRNAFQGHITCGAIVVGPRDRLLMIRHRALDRWLFPGGHIEAGDPSIRHAAQREVNEETGVPVEALAGFGNWLDRVPLQIDCHTIPANPAKKEPAHRHFDFRYAFRTTRRSLAMQPDEILDCVWVEPSAAPQPLYGRLTHFVFRER